MEKRGMRETTRKKYINALNEIHLALNYNERVNLQHICKAHNVSKAIPTVLKKHQIIRVTLNGHKWIDQTKTKVEIADLIYLDARTNNKENKIKRSNELKTIELIKPIQNDLNAWKSKVNEQKTVQSNVPIITEIQKTVETPKTFELKLFGITIIKIKR
jgi:hypothetical protein